MTLETRARPHPRPAHHRVRRRPTLRVIATAFSAAALLSFLACVALRGASAISAGDTADSTHFRRWLWQGTYDQESDADPGFGVGCEGPERPTPPHPYYISLSLLTFFTMYMFLALAIACDDCFVPALEALSERFGLSDDVAGATLMAAGGSAPELFTALVSTFQKEKAAGIAVGTVMGSAVFNILFVIGACAFAVPRSMELKLRPYPLLRDCFCYAIGLGAFATFAGITTPGVIDPWEAATMFGLYCSYVTFMAYGSAGLERRYNSKFQADVQAITSEGSADSEDGEAMMDVKDIKKQRSLVGMVMGARKAKEGGKYLELPAMGNVGVPGEDEEVPNKTPSSDTDDTEASATIFTICEDEEGQEGASENNAEKQLQGETGNGNDEEEEEDDDDDDEGPLLDRLKCPDRGSSCFTYISYLLQLPLVVLLGFTIPEVHPQHSISPEEENTDRKQVPLFSKPNPPAWRANVAFFISIFWIGTFTYVMVRCAELIGAALEVPNVVMGLTVLATGASAPDMLSSVCVARKGKGDMAVSATVGSNIFDLLLGLPLPWLLSFALPSYPNQAEIGTDGMMTSILVLVGMLFATILVMKCFSWKMGTSLGVAMFTMFIGFQTQAIWRELPFDRCR